MADLIHGRYGVEDPIWRLLGKPTNVTQSDIAARSNLYGAGLNSIETAAGITTKEGTFCAIPVQEGDIILKVTMLQAAVGSSITNQFAALYSGLTGTNKPALLAQSKAGGTAELTGETAITYELEKSVLITSTNAPNGYIFAGVNLEAATPGTQLTIPGPKVKAQYNWFPTSPTVFATTTKQKSATLAAETLEIKVIVGLEKMPIYFLT